jgi:choline dehydrogenase-like flavoprotein
MFTAIMRTIKNLDALDSSEPFDVCIIGSGPAGTTLGTELVKKGVRTLILESGGSVLRWVVDSRLKKLAAYQVTGNSDYPLKHSRARAVGGTSNFWTGRCTRFHPSDFEAHPYTPPENPWPVSYRELDAYYERAEASLRVRGGAPSEFAPRRSHPLPLKPRNNISGLKSIAEKAGIVLDDSPTATPTKSIRFFRVQKEILPPFIDSDSGTLISGVDVTRLVTNASREVSGAEITLPDGTKKTARAKLFIVACGGIESPRLLLFSRSEGFPNGIGNANDLVGRFFNEHPAVNFYASINHTRSTIMPSNNIGRSHQYYEEFRKQGLGSALFVFRQAWLLPHHNMPLKLANIPKNLKAILGRLKKATLYIGATIEMKLSNANRVVMSKEQSDCFGNPIAHLQFNFTDEDLKTLDLCRQYIRRFYEQIGATDVQEAPISWSRHHQGTCRMGDNPMASVVDCNLRVHEVPNLYVCGSEVFVTGGAMQPCLTITALAHRLADHLVDVLSKQPRG